MGLGGPNGGAYYLVDDTDAFNPVISEGSRTPYLKQYFRHIRPGSVRMEITSDNAAFDPIAFLRNDGGNVVIFKNDIEVRA